MNGAKNTTINEHDLFNLFLQLPTDELVWELGKLDRLVPDEVSFLINPRRLRGSDFLMRWAQGQWLQEIVVRTLNQTSQFGVIPLRTIYGRAGRSQRA